MSNTPIDGGLDFKVTLDDSQAKAKSQELQQEFGRIGKKATEAGTDIDALTAKMSQGFGEVATAATTAGNNIGAALASMDKKLSTLTPAIGKMGKEITTALDGVVEKTEPIEASVSQMEGAFSRVGQTIAATFGTTALLGFARSIIQTRAEFQGFEASFTTFLGSAPKAKEMLSELTRFGAETPMDLSDLVRASQTMLSFGIEGSKVVPIIKQLGDISGGSGDKLQSLSLAFSQMSSTGRLMGQDLNQMINAGFNPLAEISRTTGQSMVELKKAMEEGAISIDMVEGALLSATSAGGLFYGNLEGQSKTLRGQLGALSDAYEQMLNQMGERTEGIIGAGIGIATTAVENWEVLTKAIFAAVTAVGAYKAVIMATAALDKARSASAWVAEARSLEALLSAESLAMVQKQGLTIGTEAYTLALRKQLVTQQAAVGVTLTEAQLNAIATASKTTEATATGVLSAAKTTLTGVTARLNAVLMANPYALAAAAVAALAYGIYELVTYETAAEEATRKLKESHTEAVREYEGEKAVIDDLYRSLKEAKTATEDGTKSQKEHNEALSKYNEKKQEFIAKAPQAVSALVKERLEVNDLAGAYTALTAEVRKSIMARHREQAIKDLGDSSYEKDAKLLKEVRAKLQKAYGAEVGDKQFAQVRAAIESGRGFSKEFVQQFRRKMDAAGESLGSVYDFNDAVYKLRLSKDSKEARIKEINALYGDIEVSATKAEKAQGNVAEAAKKAAEGYKRASEQIAKIRAGKDASIRAGEEAKTIEGLKKQQEEYAKTYETLTGNSLKPKKGGGAGGGSTAKKNAQHEVAERKQRAVELQLLDEKQAQDERQRLLKQQDERVATMADGWEKEEAVLKLNAEKRKAARIKQEAELVEALRTEERKKWEAANPKAKDKGEVFDPTKYTKDNLGESAKALLAEQERIHREAELKEQREHWEKLISGAESYEQRRAKVAEEYARRREALYQHDAEGRRTAYHDGAGKSNEYELNRKEREALSAIDSEFAGRSEAFKAWMEQVATLSLEQLQATLEQAKEQLESLNGASGVDGASVAEARAKVEALYKALEKATARDKAAPQARTIRQWKDLSDIIDKGTKSFDELGEAVGGTAGKLLKSVGSIATGAFGAINSILQLTQTSATSMQATATASATAMKTVERATVILAVISAAMQVAQTIANLFNSDSKRDEEIKALQGRIDALQWEVDHSSTMQLERVVNSYEAVTEALERAKSKVGEYKGTISDIGAVVAYLNRRTEEAASRLSAVYEKVAYSANKAIGADKYSNARAQLKAMSEQQLAVAQQMNAEQKKKKTDAGKVDEYRRKLAELGEKQSEVINKLTEDVLGGDFSKMADELGDAIASAFERGEDAAEAFNRKVGDIMRDIVKRQLTEQFLMKPILDIYDRYKAKFSAVGFDPKAVVNLTTSLTRDMKEVGAKVVPAYTAAMKAVQEQLTDTLGASQADRQASKRGIAQASQESVDENNGLLRSMQGLTSEIQSDVRGIYSIAGEQLRHLAAINDNTSHLKGIREDVQALQRGMSDIQTRGVKLKD